MSAERANLADLLDRWARERPDKPAIARALGRKGCGARRYAVLSFARLEAESRRYAAALAAAGVGRGSRTLFMVPPGPDLFALSFALFRLGAVPVMIDPGMGIDRLLHCIASAAPEAMVAVPKAHLARVLFRRAFRSIRLPVTLGRRWLWGGASLKPIRTEVAAAPGPLAEARAEPMRGASHPPGESPGRPPIAETRADELAAVLFTTGSTGPAKGVEVEHGMLLRQVGQLAALYGMGERDIDCATFPLFSLLSVASGMTAVVPEMDPTRPGRADPANIAEAVNDWGCTFAFGSPALWTRVTAGAPEEGVAGCAAQGLRLPTLRRVLIAGAPVRPELHAALRPLLAADAETHTPYGATECLPVSDMKGSEILASTAKATAQGGGICVGRPAPETEIAILRIEDGPIPQWDPALVLPRGEIGEIAVTGPTVTKRYFSDEAATRLAKIREGDRLWHRMGDVGRLDEEGRLWFCGRKAHRVETTDGTLFTICCEAVFNRHPKVRRTALVGVGPRPAQRPVLIVEAGPDAAHGALEAELLRLGAEFPHTAGIRTVLFHPAFPVDVRHNAKIRREELAIWAQASLAAPRAP